MRYRLLGRSGLCVSQLCLGMPTFGNHEWGAVEASLKRLKTDFIDVLWVHAWDAMTPVDKMMRAVDDLVWQGKALYIGASNLPAWVVAQCNTLAECRSRNPFVALQSAEGECHGDCR